MTPEDRATLEWACRVVFGIDPENEVYVLRDLSIVWDNIFKIDPADSVTDASIAALAQTMKLHLGGIGFGELRNDLLGSGVGKQFANRIHDHLLDVIASEWVALCHRIRGIATITATPSPSQARFKETSDMDGNKGSGRSTHDQHPPGEEFNCSPDHRVRDWCAGIYALCANCETRWR